MGIFVILKKLRLFKTTKDLSGWSLTDLENGVGRFIPVDGLIVG